MWEDFLFAVGDLTFKSCCCLISADLKEHYVSVACFSYSSKESDTAQLLAELHWLGLCYGTWAIFSLLLPHMKPVRNVRHTQLSKVFARELNLSLSWSFLSKLCKQAALQTVQIIKSGNCAVISLCFCNVEITLALWLPWKALININVMTECCLTFVILKLSVGKTNAYFQIDFLRCFYLWLRQTLSLKPLIALWLTLAMIYDP